MENTKESQGKRQEKPGEKPELPVSILYGGIGGLNIGDQSYGPGDMVELNLMEQSDLAVFLQIMKSINSPKTNKLPYMVRNSPDGEDTKYHVRYTLVEETKKNIPPELLGVKFTPSGRYTKEETKAILALVPSFFDKKKRS